MYQDRVSSHTGEDEVFEFRSSDFDVTRFVFKDEEDVGSSDLDDLVSKKPESLLMTFARNSSGGLQGGSVISE
jgi:hypothetical protein